MKVVNIQITFASFLNFSTSSSTELTMTPPALSGGLSTFSTVSLGSTSIPKSAKLIISTGFFLALMIFYTFANLGVFNLKSQVRIAGKEI